MRLDIALASAALAVASTGSFVSADIHHELSGRDDFGKGLGFKVQHARQAGPQVPVPPTASSHRTWPSTLTKPTTV